MYKSSKFRFINKQVYNYYIPKIYNATNIIENNLPIQSKLILRSSLIGEASGKDLKSGLSLTLKNIETIESLNSSLTKIKDQKDLDEYILQEQVFFHTHLTVYIEKQFVFGEVTGTNEFVIFSAQTHTGDKEIIKALAPLIELIQKNESENVLCEIGLGSQGEIFLFQLMEIYDHPIQNYIKNDLFNILIQKKDIYLRAGLVNLIKTELMAYRVRKKSNLTKHSNIELVFFNWISLLHYFRLFCMRNKFAADSLAWQRFLIASTQENSWILKNALNHIRISSKLRQSEDMPQMPAGFKGEDKIFLGKGVHCLKVGEFIKVVKNLKIEDVQSLNDSTRLIMSDYSSLLSHPTLLLVESDKMFVGGLSVDYLDTLEDGDELEVDFDRRSLKLLKRHIEQD